VGSGFRTFTAGEVLTASNVQNYLMDQSVMVFGGSAARSSAIGTANFEEGMVSYLTDTDKVEAYNGTNWVSVAPTTSQGLTLINTTSFSGVASQSISDVFSATYTNYKILFYGNASGFTGLTLRYRVSGSDATGANYTRVRIYISDSFNPTKEKEQAQTSHNLGPLWAGHTSLTMDVFNPFATQRTQFQSINWTWNDNSTWDQTTQSGIFDNATSYTGFTIYPVSGTMTGTVSVYGYNK
jgi:hypothetical protein